MDEDVWTRLKRATEESRAEREAFQARCQPLYTIVCCECGRATPLAFQRGWTMRLDVDDEPQVFCPDCDEREFGCGF